MIFVTVGTHEQPFNRLIKYVDDLKARGIIEDEVIIQAGFSAYIPKYCKWSKMFAYQDMLKNVNDARIVITHGGPSSFMMPLMIKKIPIVVPRQKRFNEHVNDHQMLFCSVYAKRQKNIIVAENFEQLKEAIIGYDEIAKRMSGEICSNNSQFNKDLEKIVQDMFK